MVTTARLLVRPPQETDRDRFVELFCNQDFMVFYPSVLTEEQANDRFDHMVAVCQTVPFGNSRWSLLERARERVPIPAARAPRTRLPWVSSQRSNRRGLSGGVRVAE